MDEAEVEALADRVAALPPDAVVDVLLAMLEKAYDEHDRLQEAARELVVAAKTWCRAITDDPPLEERMRAVHMFAQAVDAFDPMLSETTTMPAPAKGNT